MTDNAVEVEIDKSDSTEKVELTFKVIGGVISLCVCAFIVWRIYDFFTCKPGDQSLGCVVDDAFGAGASILLGIIKGCVKQEDCNKYKNDKSTCGQTNTCKWSESNGGFCRGTTGYKAGEGGMFDIHCGLFLGFLLSMLAFGLAGLGKLGYGKYKKWKKNKKDKEKNKETGEEGEPPESEDVIEELDKIHEQAGNKKLSATDEGRESLKKAAADANNFVQDLPEGPKRTLAERAHLHRSISELLEKANPAASAEFRDKAREFAEAAAKESLPEGSSDAAEKAADDFNKKVDQEFPPVPE